MESAHSASAASALKTMQSRFWLRGDMPSIFASQCGVGSIFAKIHFPVRLITHNQQYILITIKIVIDFIGKYVCI
jgi:hypothetical protein